MNSSQKGIAFACFAHHMVLDVQSSARCKAVIPVDVPLLGRGWAGVPWGEKVQAVPTPAYLLGPQDGGAPERVFKFHLNAEVALGLVGTLHAQPELPTVAAAGGEGEDGKDLGWQGW